MRRKMKTKRKNQQIEAKAWIFPLLVHELIKGVMELAAIGWAEGHMEPDEQKHVIGRADTIPRRNMGNEIGSRNVGKIPRMY